MGKHGISRRVIYTALDDINYDWTAQEIETFLALWIDGWSLQYICRHLKREIDDAAVLMMDLGSRTSLLRDRPQGIKNQLSVDKSQMYDQLLEEFLADIDVVYTAFLDATDIEFIWDEKNVLLIEDFWNKGYSIIQIAKRFRRNKLDIALLILDRRRKGKIGLRKGGLEGWRTDEIARSSSKKLRNRRAC